MATSNVEEFHPTMEWDHDQTLDTLRVSLPGFKKEQLRVQITSSRKLRVSGEQQNADKRSRFHTEISIPSNLDSDKVSARFDNGILYVKFSKVIAPAEPYRKPPTTAPEAPVPTSESPSQKEDRKTDTPPKVEKLDKSKHSETTPKKPKDEKHDKECSHQKRIEEEKKPKGAEELDKGKRPDDGAQKRAAKKEKKKLKENAVDISETSPSGNDMKFTGGFLPRIEQPKNLIYSIVVVLLVLTLGHYLKHAFRSFVGK